MTRGGTASLLAIMMLPLAACSSPAPAVPLPTVQIVMYSGRPNPSFTLTKEQADALDACLKTGGSLPKGTVPDGLGFSFFDVMGLAAAPLLVGVEGAWLDKGGPPTPVALCPEGFSILRTAAVAALGSEEVGAIPEA
jgi:putative hemolysin